MVFEKKYYFLSFLFVFSHFVPFSFSLGCRGPTNVAESQQSVSDPRCHEGVVFAVNELERLQLNQAVVDPSISDLISLQSQEADTSPPLLEVALPITGVVPELVPMTIYDDVIEVYRNHSANEVRYEISTGFTERNLSILNNDFDLLKKINFRADKSEALMMVMGLQDSMPQSLIQWLNERFHYFISKGIELEDRIVYDVKRRKPGVSSEGGELLALNMGGAIYSAVRESVLSQNASPQSTYDVTFFLNLLDQNLGKIVLNSPRIGIVQEGPGFFQDLFREGTLEDLPHKMNRLMTLFHEARHSDGHGASLTFAHVECPIGHEYDLPDIQACDLPSNGAYRIGAEFIRAFKDSCFKCSRKTKELFELIEADNLSRILGQDFWDPQIETVETLLADY